MGRQGGVALLQKSDVVGAAHEAHVRDRFDEGLRRRDGSRLHQRGPQLAREIEFHVHLERLGNLDAAVAPFGGVVELTQCGMAGTGVVPGVRALLGRAVQALEQLDAQPRLE